MAEEKKETQSSAGPDKAEEAKRSSAETSAAKPVPSEAAAAPAKVEEKKAPAAKKERPSNCAGCNKSIRKKRWYYRDAKYYCTKRCWRFSLKKETKPEEAQAKK